MASWQPTSFERFDSCIVGSSMRTARVMTDAGHLTKVDRDVLKSIIGRIPNDWDVTIAAKDALEEFLYRRAEFVASNIVETLTPMLWPQMKSPFPPDNKGDV